MQLLDLPNTNGKASIITESNIANLKSYETIVATYNTNTKEMIVKGWYSSTTAKHINKFLEYYGFDTCNKKQLENFNN